VDGRSRDRREKINTGVGEWMQKGSAPDWCPFLNAKPESSKSAPKEPPKILQGRKDAPWGAAAEKKEEPKAKHFTFPEGLDKWIPPKLRNPFRPGVFTKEIPLRPPSTPHEQLEQIREAVNMGLMDEKEAEKMIKRLFYPKGGRW
jgi:hypothetical protein